MGLLDTTRDSMAVLFLQESVSPLSTIYSYLTQKFTFGQITVSVSSLAIGILVVALTVFVSRTAFSLIQHRLAKRRHIDPGLRYTIAQLVKFLVLTVGVLFALKQAFAVDLTSIAVVF